MLDCMRYDKMLKNCKAREKINGSTHLLFNTVVKVTEILKSKSKMYQKM